MVLTRSLLLAAACALPLSIVACGGSSGDSAIVPEGTHYGYVVSKANVPVDNKTATSYGLDLGSAKSGTPDGTVDNRLGQVLGTLATMGFDVQGTVTDAINQGSIILLVDFQTKDFMNSSAAGLSVKIGANPMPAACTNPADLTTCGKHLTGTASFSIDPKSPTDALVAGKIVNGTFNGGPGTIDLQIAIGNSATPITLSLLNARAKATAITADGMTATVGGALSATELMTQVIPAIADQVGAIIKRDCNGATPQNNCACTSGMATGATLLTLFDGKDGSTPDCMISANEIAKSPFTSGLLGPDICSTTTCTAPDALSLGIQVQTVKATFPTM
jgi:hypothetical protein